MDCHHIVVSNTEAQQTFTFIVIPPGRWIILENVVLRGSSIVFASAPKERYKMESNCGIYVLEVFEPLAKSLLQIIETIIHFDNLLAKDFSPKKLNHVLGIDYLYINPPPELICLFEKLSKLSNAISFNNSYATTLQKYSFYFGDTTDSHTGRESFYYSNRQEVFRLKILEIKRNYRDNQLNATALLADKQISKSSLSLLFRKELGISTYQYILGYRLAKAASLIFDFDIPLSRIAEMCGFDSYVTFTNAFKRYYKIPPLKHRELFKKTNIK